MKSERVEVACAICGKPLTLELPAGLDPGMRKLLTKLGRSVIHEHCATWEAKKANEKMEHEKLALRATEWGGICPPLFQDTDEAKLRALVGKNLDRIMAWKFGPKGLLLHGSTRTGKTRSAFWLLRREFDQSKAIGAMSHSEFSMKVMAMQGDDNKWKLQKWCDVLRRLDILFIDDLGKGKLSRADGAGSVAEEVLFHVFDERIKARMPTFWTTEHTSNELRDRLSFERCDSFLERLREFSLSVDFNK